MIKRVTVWGTDMGGERMCGYQSSDRCDRCDRREGLGDMKVVAFAASSRNRVTLPLPV